jgi:hypothetical protein
MWNKSYVNIAELDQVAILEKKKIVEYLLLGYDAV